MALRNHSDGPRRRRASTSLLGLALLALTSAAAADDVLPDRWWSPGQCVPGTGPRCGMPQTIPGEHTQRRILYGDDTWVADPRETDPSWQGKVTEQIAISGPAVGQIGVSVSSAAEGAAAQTVESQPTGSLTLDSIPATAAGTDPTAAAGAASVPKTASARIPNKFAAAFRGERLLGEVSGPVVNAVDPSSLLPSASTSLEPDLAGPQHPDERKLLLGYHKRPQSTASAAYSEPAATAAVKPAVATVKPVVATVKPLVATVKPAVATVKPVVATVKPVVATVKPAVGTVKPAVATTKPVVATTKPVVATTKPAAITAVRPVVEPVAKLKPKFATAIVNEIVTQLPFPETFLFPGLSNVDLFLMGTGVALKKVFGITVKPYAIGFYINVNGNVAMAKYLGQKGLAQNQAFFDALITSPADKAYVIEMNMDVSRSNMESALNEGVGAALTKQGITNATPLVQQILAGYNGDPITQYTGILIKIQGDKTVLVSFVNDVRQGYKVASPDTTISSPELAKAMNEFYLGATPRTQALKDDIADTMSYL